MLLDALPIEIHRLIFTHLTNNELVPLSTTTRNFNRMVVPALYQHTFLDFASGDGDCSAADDSHTALSALLGLAADTQGQCQYVKRLIVRSRELEGWASRDQDEEVVFDDEAIAAVGSLLDTAVRNMSHVSRIDWDSTLSTPEAVLSALRAQLDSLHCNAAWLEKSPLINFNETAALKSLTSLSVTDVVEGKVPHLLQAVLSQHGLPLKTFKLQYRKATNNNYPLPDCSLENLTKAMISKGNHVSLTTLSVSLPRAPTSTAWLKTLISPSLTDFTYHIHVTDDRRPDAAAEEEAEAIHNELFAHLHSQTQNHRMELKSLQTNTFPPSLASLIESSRNLETFILTYQPPSFCGDAINLSGHFSSLKALCLPHADRIFYNDEVIRLYGIDSFGYLRVIIENCPLLEELAMNLCAGQEDSLFKTLRAAPSLKRLFILLYRDSPWDLQLPPGHLLREMLSHYRDNPSRFFERLELFSCFRSLWVFEHTMDLTPEEVEEMEYELGYESVSDDELAALGIAIAVPDQKSEKPAEDKNEDKDDDEDDDDDLGFDLLAALDALEPMPIPSRPPSPIYDYKYPLNPSHHQPPIPILRNAAGHIIPPRHLLDEPFCYTWERAISGYYKVPFRVSWDDPCFLDEGMVNAVRGIVERYQWANPNSTSTGQAAVEDEWRRATTQTRRWD
ncbi:hypothetical protein BJY00DRAFT_62996 [Aspergillus carlsbadensis]|nr:hypothetical protein BJY00DRAFT_62996 [Aspergillus carlsbadensis]